MAHINRPSERIGCKFLELPALWGLCRESGLFLVLPPLRQPGGEPSSMIRSRDYKLIHYYEGIPGWNEDELYNFVRDPGEMNDLLADGTAENCKEPLTAH